MPDWPTSYGWNMFTFPPSMWVANIFYEHLAKVSDYTRLPLTVAAQKVQRSGYPTAYAKHEKPASGLVESAAGPGRP